MPSEEEDTDRRGSRGPNLRDLLQLQEKRKRKQRYKDKQGFTWRPFVPDEELAAVSRAPQPHLRNNGDISICSARNSSDVSLINRLRTTGEAPLQRVGPQEQENNSENSYKTATSDQDSLIPRQVSESYNKKPSNESCALERKTSVRAIQEQQYRSLTEATSGPPGNRTNVKK